MYCQRTPVQREITFRGHSHTFFHIAMQCRALNTTTRTHLVCSHPVPVHGRPRHVSGNPLHRCSKKLSVRSVAMPRGDSHGGAQLHQATQQVPSTLLRVTNVLGYVTCIAVNAVSASGLLGKTNAEISLRWPTPLTPAGWAFSIWGIIFLLQLCGVVYQALPSGYDVGSLKSDAVLAIGIYWQIGWACQCVWQLAFLLETRLGMAICAVALAGALTAFASAMFRLRAVMATHKEYRRGKTGTSPQLRAVTTFLQLPTSINAAWLSIAMGLGVLILLEAFGVSQLMIQYNAIGVAAVVVAAGVSWLLYAGDAGYGATLLWATVALSPRYRSDPYINFAQLAVMGILVSLTALSFVTRPHPPLRKRASSADDSSSITPPAQQPGHAEGPCIEEGGHQQQEAEQNQPLLASHALTDTSSYHGSSTRASYEV